MIGMLVFEVQPAEGAFGIILDPCTPDECIARCQKILGEKYLSASCAKVGASAGKLCICLG